MRKAGFTVGNALAGREACKMGLRQKRRVRSPRGPNRHSLSAAWVLVRFLQEQGTVPRPPTPPSRSEWWPVFGEFCAWMKQRRGPDRNDPGRLPECHRGSADSPPGRPPSLHRRERGRLVLARARPDGIWRAKTVVVAARAFLRFLGATGRCPPGMERAPPGFASCFGASLHRACGGPAGHRRLCRGRPHRQDEPGRDPAARTPGTSRQ